MALKCRNAAQSYAFTLSWHELENAASVRNVSTDAHSNARTIHLHGYITYQREVKDVHFLGLADPYLRHRVQLVVPKALRLLDASSDREGSPLEEISVSNLKPHTPVYVEGVVVTRNAPDRSGTQSAKSSQLDPAIGECVSFENVEIHVDTMKCLNHVLEDIPEHGVDPGPARRDLQIRTNHSLRQALRLRSKASAETRRLLFSKGFDEIETPILFKSTPEGAREFIVPTRSQGLGYALVQSPQQYKQILISSGIGKYFQIAKCFRDEDMRADRQPEFTQIDLEIAFAHRRQVQALVNDLVERLWQVIATPVSASSESTGDNHSSASELTPGNRDRDGLARSPTYPRAGELTYEQAMSRYGSDKPDRRLRSKIHRIESWVPEDLKRMLTGIEDPIIEVIRLQVDVNDTAKVSGFVTNFLDAPSSSEFINNPDGAPGVTVFDSGKPLNGLASFGYEAASQMESLLQLKPGDVILIQARPNKPFTGGSTMLGKLRRDISHAAIQKGICKAPTSDDLLWVVDFPLFSPLEPSEATSTSPSTPTVCSTHHPFTAPTPGQDLSKLETDPLSLTGDHYDLVLNGVEIGGGSVRIHQSALQARVLRDVLKLPEDRVQDFSHLLRALDSGCPPHAGFALGFDRFLALAMRRASIRDVVAFPKWGYGGPGEDRLVGSPGVLSEEVLRTYRLALRGQEGEGEGEGEGGTVSLKA